MGVCEQVYQFYELAILILFLGLVLLALAGLVAVLRIARLKARLSLLQKARELDRDSGLGVSE